MDTFPRAISTTHEVEVIGVDFDNENFANVPLEFCPALVMQFTCVTTKDDVKYTFPVAHVVSPEAGREAYLYPVGNEFARLWCEKLSIEERQ